jgi:hypothetical protein
MNYKRWFLALLFNGLFLTSMGQEINATVDITTEGIQETNKQIFDELQQAIQDFINNNIWTQDKYEIEERLICGINFNVTAFENRKNFGGVLTVSYSRPIYNSGYTSPLFTFQDRNIRFTWQQGERLEFVDNQHLSNLTSIIAFYMNTIIGIDRDSFLPGAGNPFYLKAQSIVNNAQNDPMGIGWRSMDGNRNRFWLVDNLVSSSFENFSKCIYAYHRKGLDLLHDEARQQEAKDNIIAALLLLEDIHKNRPNSFLMQVFMDTKSDEIISIFSGGPTVNVEPLKELMKKLDPKNSNKYDALGVISR